MARLVYSAIASLDGYVEDEDGKFDWAVPDEELHSFVNEHERPIGTYLYGRRMYETMRFWEDNGDEPGDPAVMREYAAIWRDTDKVVYSRTLNEVTTARTRLERELDPDSVRAMKAAAERDLGIGGAELAARAFAANLIDEVDLFLHPISVGGGKTVLPRGLRVNLELLGHRRFESGVVHLRYRVS